VVLPVTVDVDPFDSFVACIALIESLLPLIFRAIGDPRSRGYAVGRTWTVRRDEHFSSGRTPGAAFPAPTDVAVRSRAIDGRYLHD
jgi:hypothetical protein